MVSPNQSSFFRPGGAIPDAPSGTSAMFSRTVSDPTRPPADLSRFSTLQGVEGANTPEKAKEWFERLSQPPQNQNPLASEQDGEKADMRQILRDLIDLLLGPEGGQGEAGDPTLGEGALPGGDLPSGGSSSGSSPFSAASFAAPSGGGGFFGGRLSTGGSSGSRRSKPFRSGGRAVPQSSSVWSRLRDTMMNGVRSGANILKGLGNKFNSLLDWWQGDNKYGASGNCGLVSTANVLRMAGVPATENDITGYALRNGLCERSGATAWSDQAKILNHYGVPASVNYSNSLENIAKDVENNKGVILGVNANNLWYNKGISGKMTHAVTLTGVVRDKASKQIKGFTICDSGAKHKQRFVPYQQMVNATGGTGRAITVTTKKRLA